MNGYIYTDANAQLNPTQIVRVQHNDSETLTIHMVDGSAHEANEEAVIILRQELIPAHSPAFGIHIQFMDEDYATYTVHQVPVIYWQATYFIDMPDPAMQAITPLGSAHLVSIASTVTRNCCGYAEPFAPGTTVSDAIADEVARRRKHHEQTKIIRAEYQAKKARELEAEAQNDQ